MSANLRLTGQQATLTVHSMLSRTNGPNANKAGETVNVVVKVAEKSPPKISERGMFDDSVRLNSDDFLTRLEFESKLELFLQAQTNLVAACEKLRQENQQYRQEYKNLQRKVYVLEELLKNDAQMTTRYNIMDNSISNMNKEIGRIRKDVTFLSEDQDKCNTTMKQIQKSVNVLHDKIQNKEFEKALVRRAVSAVLKSKQLSKIQTNVAYNVDSTTNLLHRIDAAEKTISKLQNITEGIKGFQKTIDQIKQRTTLLETSSTLRPLELLGLGEGEDEKSDISDDDDDDEGLTVKRNSDIYNRLDLLEKANFSLRLALGEKANRNFKKNKLLQQQINIMQQNDQYPNINTNLQKLQLQMNANNDAIETFKSIINNLVIDVSGQKAIQNKEILRLDRQLRLSSIISPSNNNNNNNNNSNSNNTFSETTAIPNYMRPKGFKRSKPSAFAKQIVLDNQTYSFNHSPEVYQNGHRILSSKDRNNNYGNSSSKIQIRIPTSNKEREPYKRSNVKMVHTGVE